MSRTLLISDIHGELYLFKELLEQVKYDDAKDQLILLGDYIDRGLASKEVLDFIMTLKENGAKVLMGNHEQIMLDVFEKENKYEWDFWLYTAGGLATMRSYGFTEKDLKKAGDLHDFSLHNFLCEDLIKHLEFIRHLDTSIEQDNYIFVHAGVDPNIPFNQNTKKSLLWIRDEFHQKYEGQKIVIFGHTPTKHLHQDRLNNKIYFGENRIIGIDGGATFGGQLNCLELPSQKVYFVQK